MVDSERFMEPLLAKEIAIRIGGALLCGALVGLERERKHRPAGFRTMILISLGSCGFVLLGAETVARVGIDTTAVLPAGAPIPGQAEMSRVIQGLMGGIGFLGAGAVLQSKKAVRGLTTAAAVWVVAALGAACGCGLYNLAIILGAATMFTLIVLDLVEDRFFPDPEEQPDFKEKKNGEKAIDLANGNGNGDAGPLPAMLRGDDYPASPRSGPQPPATAPRR
jgi:putative Mg2+ transporter-C (MgtC) family protein